MKQYYKNIKSLGGNLTMFGFNYTAVNDGPKIGRNESCPCGSGKKYKKCCLGKEQYADGEEVIYQHIKHMRKTEYLGSRE